MVLREIGPFSTRFGPGTTCEHGLTPSVDPPCKKCERKIKEQERRVQRAKEEKDELRKKAIIEMRAAGFESMAALLEKMSFL